MEVSFPEDWPETQPELRRLDRSLRCNICRDFLEGPVSLACGHACELILILMVLGWVQGGVMIGDGGGVHRVA